MLEAAAPRSHREAAEGFLLAVQPLHILSHQDDLVEDVIGLREAFPDLGAYVAALDRVAHELSSLAPRSRGAPMRATLAGWMKRRFAAWPDDPVEVLRLVFRVRGNQVELLAFGHRFEPRDFYRRATRRVRP